MAFVTNMRYELWFQELWSLTISQEQETRFEALFQVFGKWHTDSSLTTSLALRLNLPAPPSLIIFGKRWKTPRSRCYTTEVFFLNFIMIMRLFNFYSTRPKPAYGWQGLDWIVGPGYSFVVFSNQKPWNHLEKPWKPTKNHEKPWNHLEKPWKPVKNH